MGQILSNRSNDYPSLEAFNRLVVDTQDKSFTLAYAFLGGKLAAERAVQKAYIQAYQSAGRWNGSNPSLWVYRAVLTTCQKELGNLPVENNPPLVTPESDGWQSILALPVDLRVAVALVDLAGLDYVQAAKVAGLTTKELGKRLSKARVLLVSEKWS